MMYRGFSPTVIGSAVYSGIGFGTYETLKKFHAGKLLYCSLKALSHYDV